MQHEELLAISETIQEIREQLPLADDASRQIMMETLSSLRAMAASILDAWMAVDDAIEETYADLFADDDMDNVLEPSSTPIAAKNTAKMDVSTDTTSHHSTQPPSKNNHRTQTLFDGPVPLAEAWFDLSLKPEYHLRKGLGFYDLAMFDEASSALATAIQHRDLPQTRIYLALSHLSAGRIDEAELELDLAHSQSTDPLTIQAILEVETQICAAREDWHGAIRVLYNLLSTETDQGDLWFNLGICHVRLYEFQAAQRCFEKAVSTHHEDVEAILWRALTLVWTEQLEKHTQIAPLLGGMRVKTDREFQLLVMLYLALGQFDAATSVASTCRSQPIHWSQGTHLLALCHAAMGQPNQAVLLCKALLTMEPDNVAALSLLGIALFLQGDIRRAERVLARSDSQDLSCSHSSMIPLLRGRIASIRGDVVAARQHFHRISVTSHPAIRRMQALYEGMLALHVDDANQANRAFARAAQLGVPQNAIDLARLQ